MQTGPQPPPAVETHNRQVLGTDIKGPSNNIQKPLPLHEVMFVFEL